MLRTRLMPLRSTVGAAVPLGSVKVVRKSSAASTTRPTLKKHSAVTEIAAIDFTNYLPQLHDIVFTSPKEHLGIAPPKEHLGIAPFSTIRVSHPIAGSERIPLPRSDDFPFSSQIDFASLHVLLINNATVKSRDLWLDLEFRFRETQTIGGICYLGLPQLPYRITPQGENSANFGLPREIRILWERTAGGFIDDEAVTTRQEPASHSGVHVLCTESFYTDRLTVRLGDWPRFITRLETKEWNDKSHAELVESYGLAIPMIFPFTYKEATRYRAHVPMGVLASVKSPGEGPSRYLIMGRDIGDDPVESPGKGPSLDPIMGRDIDDELGMGVMNSSYLFRDDTAKGQYFTFSDSSASGSNRRFEHDDGLIESYVSVPLGRDELIRFYVEQAECYARCIAGLKIAFGRPKLDSIAKRKETRVSIYELDMVEGASVVDLSVEPAQNKYATLLFDTEITSDSMNQTCRFHRPSLSRYFVFEFKNLSDRRSQICIDDMTLVQSSGVTVSPRKSRAQLLQNMHYRLVGPDLATDYALIGDKGFSLSVDISVAGQRTSTLFRANSLLDLVQSGSARVIANQRRWETLVEVTREISDTNPGSYDDSERLSRSGGWRRSETGDGIDWSEKDEFSLPDGEHGFVSINNSEVRTQTEHIANEGLPAFLEAFEPVFQALFPNYSTENITTQLPRLLAQDMAGFNWKDDVWRGIQDVDFQGVLSQISMPPWVHAPHSAIDGLVDAIREIAAWIDNPLSVPSGPNIQALTQLIATVPGIGLANGFSMGLSVGFQAGAGGSFSFSGDRFFPALSYTATRGRAGTIAKQANKTGYSYSQYRNAAYDRTQAKTAFLAGRMDRTIKRKPNQEGTDRKRTAGAEVMWQDELTDIVIGRVPLNITLPATAENMYRTTDHSVTVRLGSNLSKDLSVDVWFDIAEEIVREDY